MIKCICTGILIFIPFERSNDDNLNGSINGIYLGLSELFKDGTMLAKFYLAVK